MTRVLGEGLVAFTGLRGGSVGGGHHEALSAAEALKDAGFRVSLLCGSEPDFTRLSRELGVKNSADRILTLRLGFTERMDFLKPFLRGLQVPSVKPDLWVSFDADGDPFLIPLTTLYDDSTAIVFYFISANLSRFWKVGVNADSRRLIGKAYWKVVSKLLRKVVKRVALHGSFIAISRYSAGKIEKLIGVRPKIHYGSINGEVYRWRGENKEDFMAAAGRLTPYKRFDAAVEAAKMLGRKLVILGALKDLEYYEELRRRILREGLSDLVEIALDLPLEKRSEILRRAKVFLHCSIEGFGKAVAEAMAAGCIPVVPRIGGQSEYTPRRFHYSSFDEMLQKIEEAFDAPPSLARELSERAMEFDLPRYKRKFISLLREEELIV